MISLASAQLPRQMPPGPVLSRPGLGNRLRGYTVGGGFSIILGAGLVLEVNGTAPITINSSAPFRFPMLFFPGAHYDVEIKTQPHGQFCTLSSNKGVIGNHDVTDVSVACNLTGRAFQVSFVSTGAKGSGLVVTDGFAQLFGTSGQVAAFPWGLAEGSPYSIWVVTQPTNPAQTCSVVANGSGIVDQSSILHPAQVVCR